jgi:hypothetical protein
MPIIDIPHSFRCLDPVMNWVLVGILAVPILMDARYDIPLEVCDESAEVRRLLC